jgi:hypothetical protein
LAEEPVDSYSGGPYDLRVLDDHELPDAYKALFADASARLTSTRWAAKGHRRPRTSNTSGRWATASTSVG